MLFLFFFVLRMFFVFPIINLGPPDGRNVKVEFRDPPPSPPMLLCVIHAAKPRGDSRQKRIEIKSGTPDRRIFQKEFKKSPLSSSFL